MLTRKNTALCRFIAFRQFSANLSSPFVSTFNFPPLQRKPTKIKRASKAPLGFRADNSATLTVLCINAGNRASDNRGLAKVAVSVLADSSVHSKSFELRKKFSAKIRHLRKPPARYRQPKIPFHHDSSVQTTSIRPHATNRTFWHISIFPTATTSRT